MAVKQKSIKINFIMNAILTVSNVIFPIISFPYASRILTPDGTGKVSTAMSVIAFFNIFAQLGIPTYGIKACAQVRDNREELTRTAHELLMINLIMSFVMYVLLFFAILFVPVLKDEKLLYVIVSATILLTSIGMEWLYKGLEQYAYITARSVIFKLVSLVLLFILIHAKKDYALYGFITIFATSASNILNFINARKYIDLKPVGNYNLKRHLKPVGVFLGMACATTIYTNLDRVMLRYMTDDTEVGLYDAAVKIKHVMQTVVNSLGAVLLPRASYYVEMNMKDAFRKVASKALSFVFMFAGAVTIYFIVMAKASVLLVSGSLYEGAALPMQIIFPTVLIIGVSYILGLQVLVPLGREKELLYAETGGAIIDVIINILLIKYFRSAGVAIGTLAAEIFVMAYLVISLRKELKGLIDEKDALKTFVSLLTATPLMLVSLYLSHLFSVDFLADFLSNLFGDFRWIGELESLKELVITFTVFSVSYLIMVLILKESIAWDAVGKLFKKGRIK